MSRRGEILKEMGLAPVWRLRDRVAEAPSAPAKAQMAKPILEMDWPELKVKVAGCTDCKLRPGYYPAHAGREDALVLTLAL